MKKYVVKPGDTLYQISKRTGVRIPLLLAANPQIQDPSQLMAGMDMVIPELGKPAKGEPAAKSAKPSATMPPYFGFVWPHQVAQGETWDALAKKYGVKLEQLHHVNPEAAQAGKLQPGDIVYVPTAAYPTPASKAKPGTAKPPGTVPASKKPSTGAGNKSSNQTNQVTGTSTDGMYGPHTHYPYRSQAQQRADTMDVPPNWYVDDESSSLFAGDALEGRSSQDLRSTSSNSRSLPATDGDGWSDAFTVRLDGDQ